MVLLLVLLLVSQQPQRKCCAEWRDLPDGAVIGSASLRRQAQLLAMNPTLNVVNFRGNVQTRLKKIENGTLHAWRLRLDFVGA